MRTSDVFPSRFVKAADIGDKEVIVTIDRVEMEDVGDDHKPVEPAIRVRAIKRRDTQASPSDDGPDDEIPF
jgi:hypothetical protein